MASRSLKQSTSWRLLWLFSSLFGWYGCEDCAGQDTEPDIEYRLDVRFEEGTRRKPDGTTETFDLPVVRVERFYGTPMQTSQRSFFSPAAVPGTLLQLIEHPVVREELQLSEDQIQQLVRLGEKEKSLRQNLSRQMAKEGENATVLLDGLNLEIKLAIQSILNTNQSKRLRQLDVQRKLLMFGPAVFTIDADLRELTGISEHDRLVAHGAAKELQEKFLVRARRLYRGMLKEWLQAALNDEQYAQLKELTGVPANELMNWETSDE